MSFSTGSLLLLVHERPNGDITLAFSHGETDAYRLETTEATSVPPPTSAKHQRIQQVVRCSDNAILASVSWIEPRKDLVRVGNAKGDVWVKLDEAWKAADPTKGDCVETFTGSDNKTYEWRLELRNMRKLYGLGSAECIATETQFTPRGHTLELTPADCTGVGDMLYITLLIGLARRRPRGKRGFSGKISRAIEGVFFM
ncbi:hypothetical protein FRC10_002672 [Ceratobasidium sp. 414]|nr:hypothetical protein FRC10_002672 [Ceratobasidium sp. 414]